MMSTFQIKECVKLSDWTVFCETVTSDCVKLTPSFFNVEKNSYYKNANRFGILLFENDKPVARILAIAEGKVGRISLFDTLQESKSLVYFEKLLLKSAEWLSNQKVEKIVSFTSPLDRFFHPKPGFTKKLESWFEKRKWKPLPSPSLLSLSLDSPEIEILKILAEKSTELQSLEINDFPSAVSFFSKQTEIALFQKSFQYYWQKRGTLNVLYRKEKIACSLQLSSSPLSSFESFLSSFFILRAGGFETLHVPLIHVRLPHLADDCLTVLLSAWIEKAKKAGFKKICFHAEFPENSEVKKLFQPHFKVILPTFETDLSF